VPAFNAAYIEQEDEEEAYFGGDAAEDDYYRRPQDDDEVGSSSIFEVRDQCSGALSLSLRGGEPGGAWWC
jgi:hypothetical protein